MNKQIVHFTIGPVQAFIGDARRTRDLWAGSFLLSWLAGHAMAALVEHTKKDAGEVIVFPSVVDDDLFRAIQESRLNKRPSSAPYIGSLPNRFKANVSGLQGDPGRICKAAVLEAWHKLEQAVWSQFLNKLKGFSTVESEKIWRRQVDNFWQINWVQGDEPIDGSDSSWLDLRKNWRDGAWGNAGSEPGDLCRLMGRYQEVSSYARIGSKHKQDAYYEALREQTYQTAGADRSRRRLGQLNIADSERLCALALVKRLFPLLDSIEDIIGWRPGGTAVNVVNWPSVSYVATLPWLDSLSRAEAATHTRKYYDAVSQNLSGNYRGETETKLFGLPSERFFTLDGQLLHLDGLDHWPIDDFKGTDEQSKKASRDTLRRAYLDLAESSTGKQPENPRPRTTPSEFYALLLMDGDQVGARMRSHAQTIKQGLSFFVEKVKAYFDPKSANANPSRGSLIYAGGDDVLAILPLDHALTAAKAIRESYRQAFDQAIGEACVEPKPGDEFTLSAAIILAQYKIPLRFVLEKAHYYLDSIAKEGNGRDSLAIAALKPGGVAFDWVSTWSGDAIGTFEKVARNRSDYTSSFLYNLRQRYMPLFTAPSSLPEEEGSSTIFAQPDFLQAILAAEYKKEPGRAGMDSHAAIETIKPLITIGRTEGRTNAVNRPNLAFDFNGSLLARFIGSEGYWDDNER